MPSSPQRRRVELPVALYETLAAQARQEQRAVAGLVVEYILDGMSLREHYGQLSAEIAVLRGEVRQLTRPPPGALTLTDQMTDDRRPDRYQMTDERVGFNIMYPPLLHLGVLGTLSARSRRGCSWC
jgi:hypothetical protein